MSVFGSDPDNPVSGDMPADKLEGSDTVVGLGETELDDDFDDSDDEGSVNDIGGVGSTAATLHDED